MHDPKGWFRKTQNNRKPHLHRTLPLPSWSGGIPFFCIFLGWKIFNHRRGYPSLYICCVPYKITYFLVKSLLFKYFLIHWTSVAWYEIPRKMVHTISLHHMVGLNIQIFLEHTSCSSATPPSSMLRMCFRIWSTIYAWYFDEECLTYLWEPVKAPMFFSCIFWLKQTYFFPLGWC